MKQRFNRFLGLYLPPHLKVNIEVRALNEGRSISAVVREVLQREFEHGKKETDPNS
jgi:hypothetical protein